MLPALLWLGIAPAYAPTCEDPRPPAAADRARAEAQAEASTKLLEPHAQLPSTHGDARLDDAALQALQRGLAWLAARAHESPEGSLPPVGLSPSTGRGFASVAVDALAALAWMGDGSTPERGPYGGEVARAIDVLLAHVQTESEASTPGYVALAGDGLSRMHGHGLATLALSQAWTCSPRSERGARLAHALPLAVRCIERSQGLEGGWWYEPRKALEHEGSITITMAQALRSARHAGVGVDPGTVAHAVDYVRRSQKEDGSFRYALADPSSSIALSAAAIATLEASGTYGGREIDAGYAWLLRALELRASGASQDPNPFEPETSGRAERRLYCNHYERLYVAQCLWQHADPQVWEHWARAETARVLTAQRADGAWSDAQFGDAYATAMCCLFLEVPLGLLPIFQR